MIGRRMVIAGAGATLGGCNLGVSSAKSKSPPLLIFIRNDGALTMEGRVVDIEEVRRRAGSNRVYLTAEPTIGYAEFMRALEQLRGLNIPIAIVGEEAR